MNGFEQATIKVEKEQEFQELKGAIDRALSPENAGKFLKRLASCGIRVRDFDSILAQNVFDQASGNAGELYRVLSLSDQAQMREFYLSRIEEIDARLRTKYRKLYQYY
jgi:hypothetical protein